jgi:undecaprenyl-diphosphatase
LQRLLNRLSLDRTVVLLLGAASISAVLFFCMCLLVSGGLTKHLDIAVLTHLRTAADLNVTVGPGQLLTMARDVTALGDATVLTMITVMTLGYCLLTRYWAAFFMIFISVNSSNLTMILLKLFFHRQRPDVVPHLVTATMTSFPSGHAMMSAVVYLTIGAILARIEPRRTVKMYLLSIFAVLSLVIGMTRVFLGVHYPSDVIAGWLAGIALGTFCAAMVLIVDKKMKNAIAVTNNR